MLDSLQGSRVFVSGGAGVIGNELIPILAGSGAEIMSADLKPRPIGWPTQVRHRQGDLNFMPLSEVLEFAPDIFIHLAATFERTIETPEFWTNNFDHNVRLSHHLMTLMRDVVSLRRVVFASSYLIYDPDLYLFECVPDEVTQLREVDPVRPRNLTGMAKLAHEQELEFLASIESTPFTVVSARIFRGYGRGSRCVVSRWVRSLLAGEPITVYRPEGQFDYVFAKDTAEGLARLAASEMNPPIINLGTGRTVSVGDVVQQLLERFPDAHVIQNDSGIKFEASCADTSILARTIDWVPPTTIGQGIDAIIEYEQVHDRDDTGSSLGNILVSSASGKVPLLRHVEQVLSHLDPKSCLIAGDIDSNTLARHVVREFWQMPPTTTDNVDELIAGMRARGVRFVIPTRDGELAFYAEHAIRFKDAGIAVMSSTPPAVACCLDKQVFAERCHDLGLPAIPTSTVIDDVPESAMYVVKERFGAGSRSIGLGLDRNEALLWANRLEHPIFQPHLPGVEFSIDVFRSERSGEVASVVRSRDLVIDGESKISTIHHDAEIAHLAHAVVEGLDIVGHAVVQVMRIASGLHIIECNPRIGSASTLSFAAGLHSIEWFVADVIGELRAPSVASITPTALRLVRTPEDSIE